MPLWLIGFAVGVAFGLLTNYEVWPDSFAFPYVEVTAPAGWILIGLSEVATDFVMQSGDWLGPVLLGLWYGLFGLFFVKNLL